jgi:hypothetical protein
VCMCVCQEGRKCCYLMEIVKTPAQETGDMCIVYSIQYVYTIVQCTYISTVNIYTGRFSDPGTCNLHQGLRKVSFMIGDMDFMKNVKQPVSDCQCSALTNCQ